VVDVEVVGAADDDDDGAGRAASACFSLQVKKGNRKVEKDMKKRKREEPLENSDFVFENGRNVRKLGFERFEFFHEFRQHMRCGTCVVIGVGVVGGVTDSGGVTGG